MYSLELYGRVRRAVLAGRSQRSVAREFGLGRVTVRQMLGYSILPGYRQDEAANRPNLELWVGVIDAIVEAGKRRPVKQRPARNTVCSATWTQGNVLGGL